MYTGLLLVHAVFLPPLNINSIIKLGTKEKGTHYVPKKERRKEHSIYIGLILMQLIPITCINSQNDQRRKEPCIDAVFLIPLMNK